MKKKMILTMVLGVFGAGLISMKDNNGQPQLSGYRKAHLRNGSGAPVAKTGAPGEASCVACHTGSVLDGNGINSLIMLNAKGDPVSSYLPDSTYTLIFNNTDPSGKKGFQLTGLKVSDDLMAGVLLADPATGTNLVSDGARNYINHTGASTGTTTGWSFQWTAPSGSPGEVRFYAAANATNSSGTPAGDKIYLSQHSFPMKSSLSLEENAAETKQQVYFDSKTQQIKLLLHSQNPSTASVKIVDQTGRKVAQKQLGEVKAGKSEFEIALPGDYPKGIYFVYLQLADQTQGFKVLI